MIREFYDIDPPRTEVIAPDCDLPERGDPDAEASLGGAALHAAPDCDGDFGRAVLLDDPLTVGVDDRPVDQREEWENGAYSFKGVSGPPPFRF